MLLNLVKKDFILAKNYLLVMLLFIIGAPIFIAFQIRMNSGGFLEFFITTFFALYLLFNTVSLAEDKSKGATLLCATPYTRKALVQAKYLFILTTFVCCLIIYIITAVVAPLDLPMLHLSVGGITFLIITIFFGILIPAQYRFGYEKTKYIFMLLVFVSPFIVPTLVMHTNNIQITLPVPAIIHNLLPCVLAVVIGYISMIVSLRIYSKKSL